MDEEALEELTAAIKALTFSTNVQCELLESLNAKQSDLMSQIQLLRTVIEHSAKS